MKKISLIIIVIILVTAVLYFVTSKKQVELIGSTTASTPAPIAAPVAPKTFNFDSSTDLKMELDKVNPQVLDSDFQ